MGRWDKWHDRFIKRAFEVAGWSKDPSSQVGAVIVHGKRAVSEGYNGPPQCWDDDATLPRHSRLRVTIHAEENAILFAQRDLVGATLFVTHHPCAPCAAKIAQVGISRVVMPPQSPEFVLRWQDDVVLAQSIFRQAYVSVHEMGEAP